MHSNIVVLRRNPGEVEFPSWITCYNFDDYIDDDTAINSFVSNIQKLIVNINNMERFNKLIICDNQSLANVIYYLAKRNVIEFKEYISNYNDCEIIRNNIIHNATNTQEKLLGGIINNFNGNIRIIKRDENCISEITMLLNE